MVRCAYIIDFGLLWFGGKAYLHIGHLFRTLDTLSIIHINTIELVNISFEKSLYLIHYCSYRYVYIQYFEVCRIDGQSVDTMRLNKTILLSGRVVSL